MYTELGMGEYNKVYAQSLGGRSATTFTEIWEHYSGRILRFAYGSGPPFRMVHYSESRHSWSSQ